MENISKSIIGLLENIITPDNIKTYNTVLLGTKKDGRNRTIYDLIKDKKRNKKRKKWDKNDPCVLYASRKRKRRKGKKKSKYWSFD